MKTGWIVPSRARARTLAHGRGSALGEGLPEGHEALVELAKQGRVLKLRHRPGGMVLDVQKAHGALGRAENRFSVDPWPRIEWQQAVHSERFVVAKKLDEQQCG